ncbi:uncharacterized protein BDZ83DRAFT_4414 [Colletotrichum acutatum]|uniref:Uncharacterized protein n=1 Tax=Glomerella acutata TaxID=27357 RepID=A0AAD8XQZ7_GLOAC|nr:uncharacterized protein BDZ83DRAFT_4414 [Colletotrichum acutatum]KAK1731781.1 hypothetical protein BDZ83DRAFT_4414 [Colletotrichum acutatum]
MDGIDVGFPCPPFHPLARVIRARSLHTIRTDLWAELRLEMILSRHQSQRNAIFQPDLFSEKSIRKIAARMGVILNEAVSCHSFFPTFNNTCNAAPGRWAHFSFRQFSTTEGSGPSHLTPEAAGPPPPTHGAAKVSTCCSTDGYSVRILHYCAVLRLEGKKQKKRDSQMRAREGQERRATARFISRRPVAGCCRIDIDERAAGWADEMQRGSVECVQWRETESDRPRFSGKNDLQRCVSIPFPGREPWVHCCELSVPTQR